MRDFVIHLEDSDVELLEKKARESGMSPQEFGGKRLHEVLSSSENQLDDVFDYIVKKNQELYSRLA